MSFKYSVMHSNERYIKKVSSYRFFFLFFAFFKYFSVVKKWLGVTSVVNKNSRHIYDSQDYVNKIHKKRMTEEKNLLKRLKVCIEIS